MHTKTTMNTKTTMHTKASMHTQPVELTETHPKRWHPDFDELVDPTVVDLPRRQDHTAVIDLLDPATNGAAPPRPAPRRPRSRSGAADQRARAVEHRRRQRTARYQRLEAIFSWAEERGHNVHTDALLTIVETEDDFQTWPPDCWTEHGLWQFLWSELNNACVLTGRDEPQHVPETMWLYLDFLHSTVGLAAGSDDIETLRRFLKQYGDLTDDGRPRAAAPGTAVPAGQFQLDLGRPTTTGHLLPAA